MTFRVNVYATTEPDGHRLVSDQSMEEHQAVNFMEVNARRHMGKFLAVIKEETSVGEAV